MAGLKVSYQAEDIAPGGRIGLIALATDYNSETDLRRMLPVGVDMFTNRVQNANPVTLENLRAMRSDITRAAAGILPQRGVDAMIFGCTSAVAVIGEAEITERVQQAHPEVHCTNPVTAATAALSALGKSDITILTPYTDEVNEAVETCFRERGLNIVNIVGLGLDNDIDMTELPVSVIEEAARKSCHPDAEALFISCTAIRAASAVDALEKQLNRPVVTSNQALVWHCLRLMNNQTRVRGFGSLFDMQLLSAAAQPGRAGLQEARNLAGNSE